MTNFWRKLYSFNARYVLGNKDVRHAQASLIFSQEDLTTNDFLIDLAADAIRAAWKTRVDIRDETLPDSRYYNIFPGEHYRLLKAIVSSLAPQSIVEIGTYTGMGTLALAQAASNGFVSTFDSVPWDTLESHLVETDFTSGKVVQHLGDLSQPDVFRKHFELLNSSELIFIDAPKNGVFEYEIMDLLKGLDRRDRRLLILDDIRFVNMIDLWRSIRSPKLDVSAFGHWSGTGIVDISAGLELAS